MVARGGCLRLLACVCCLLAIVALAKEEEQARASTSKLYELKDDVAGGRKCLINLRSWFLKSFDRPVPFTEDLDSKLDLSQPLKAVVNVPAAAKRFGQAVARRETCRDYVVRELRIWGLDQDERIVLNLQRPKEHISQAFDCIMQSKYHTRHACQLMSPAAIRPTEQLKAMALESVCHAVFLDAMFDFIQADFARAGAIFDQLYARVRGFSRMVVKVPVKKWEFLIVKHSDMFTSVKLNTIFAAIKPGLQAILDKQPSTDPTVCSDRVNSISINILEATWTDLYNDRPNNVEAGLVLAATPTLGKSVPSLRTQPDTITDKEYLMFQPLPDLWGDLYGFWNQVFVAAQFRDWPKFWAKLLNVKTVCHRRTLGSYLFYRGINLMMHIIHEAMVRNVRGHPDPPVDLVDRTFVDYLGSSSRVSAREYFESVLAVPESRHALASFDAGLKGTTLLHNLLTGKEGRLKSGANLMRFVLPFVKRCAYSGLVAAKHFGASLLRRFVSAVGSAVSGLAGTLYRAVAHLMSVPSAMIRLSAGLLAPVGPDHGPDHGPDDGPDDGSRGATASPRLSPRLSPGASPHAAPVASPGATPTPQRQQQHSDDGTAPDGMPSDEQLEGLIKLLSDGELGDDVDEAEAEVQASESDGRQHQQQQQQRPQSDPVPLANVAAAAVAPTRRLGTTTPAPVSASSASSAAMSASRPVSDLPVLKPNRAPVDDVVGGSDDAAPVQPGLRR